MKYRVKGTRCTTFYVDIARLDDDNCNELEYYDTVNLVHCERSPEQVQEALDGLINILVELKLNPELLLEGGEVEI